jgi:hypothetical protein
MQVQRKSTRRVEDMVVWYQFKFRIPIVGLRVVVEYRRDFVPGRRPRVSVRKKARTIRG